MPKAEISWERTTEEGRHLQCYAQHVGKNWVFRRREARFDRWIEVKDPPVDDWLALLDAIRRRINRRLARPEEEARLMKIIAERFPDAAINNEEND